MTPEQKDKLEQTIKSELSPERLGCDEDRRHAAIVFFSRGAQTILDNPWEWGLCPKNDVAKERTKWIKELQQRGLNHDKAMTDACGQIVDLEDEVSRLREALERIANADAILYDTFAILVAKEALKQQP